MEDFLSQPKNSIITKLKLVFLAIAVLTALSVATLIGIQYSFMQGQAHACNVIIRQIGELAASDLYCDISTEGVLIKSKQLRKTLYNVSTDSPL